MSVGTIQTSILTDIANAIRYQAGVEDVTGYSYEPWHIRYVGKDVAAEIYEKNITLEEFLRDIK